MFRFSHVRDYLLLRVWLGLRYVKAVHHGDPLGFTGLHGDLAEAWPGRPGVGQVPDNIRRDGGYV